ncbi:MAG TPA: SBBP repeat-containing protein [Pyrinomonadaceae bacterium]
MPALVLSTAAALLAAPLMLNRHEAPAPAAAGEQTQTSPEQARETYGRIPLSFEANRGQTEPTVDFLARGAGYALFLKPTEAVFVLLKSDSRARIDESAAVADQQSENPPSKVLRMKLVGADASAAAEGASELAGKANYFVGHDPSQWRTDVPTFGRVRYAEVYPGVDVVYYGNQRQLEYDFSVAPGRDPRAVSLKFEGADRIDVDANGDLLLTVGETVVRQPKPYVYQEVAGARREVEGGYVVGADGRVGFSVGEYDRGAALVIDPVLVYSTYLGGSGTDLARAIAVDPSGNAVVTGYTQSLNFPTANAFQAAFNGTEGFFGNRDVFVTKINAAGTAYVYSTYLGGTGSEEARGIAVDSAGNAYVAGFTDSTNFPIANAVQATMGGTQDAFVTKLNPAGSALVYSTFLGGAGFSDGANSAEFGEAIAVDSSGNAYVTGSTFSNNFPLVNAVQETFKGGSTDAFVTKINAAGDAFVYSTYLGGNGDAAVSGVGGETGRAIAADSAGNTYVAGETNSSTDFPLANAVRGTYGGGGSDAFVAKIDPAGDALIYSTYLGGNAQDSGEGVKADASGNTYVAGFTLSNNFPVANAFQGTHGGGQDAFVTKLNPTGSALVYSTYFGGTGPEIAFGIAVDASGSVHLAGTTGSLNSLPTANAIQCTRNAGFDLFVTKFNAAGSALVYSTYLGGSEDDRGEGIALDPSNNAYVTGATTSTDFPTVHPIQGVNAGGSPFGDAFVTKVSDTSTGAASALAFTQTAPSVQEDVTSLTLTVQRTGDTSGAATVDYATSNGTASERSDYTTALGTLRFAAGETAKTIDILINEDSFTEGNETFTVSLSNPTGGATLSCQTAVATVQITDDATEPSTNAIDDTTVFVGTHYHDFLNRQADVGGLNFWTGQITPCGTDAACLDRKRTDVSQAFFLSIEFQQTGFLVHRFYKASFPNSPARPRGMARYREFLRDTQEIGRGVVVNQAGWEQVLEENKRAFTLRWVQRPDFLAEFPVGMGFDAYVAKLAANSGTTLTPAEINVAFESYSETPQGRANALRAVLESGSVYNAQFNTGFVLSQYIGYLRRNPNDSPDEDYTGFDYWLMKLNSFSQPGEDVRNEQTALARVNRAEMVRAFILSLEYRGRFGQP